jgi:hypothetical protein
MALIPKVEPKQEKKVVSARLDEEMHTLLQRYAAFLGGGHARVHHRRIAEALVPPRQGIQPMAYMGPSNTARKFFELSTRWIMLRWMPAVLSSWPWQL